MATAATPNRQALIRQGQRLEFFTIAYNSAEGLVSIFARIFAGSVSLVGFGLDIIIEVASGAATTRGGNASPPAWRRKTNRPIELKGSQQDPLDRAHSRIAVAVHLAPLTADGRRPSRPRGAIGALRFWSSNRGPD